MPPFIPDFIKNTLSFLAFTWLGAAGLLQNTEVTDRGIMSQMPGGPNFTLGNISYYGRNNKQHEFGHLVEEDLLGPLYLPIAGLTSLVGNVLGATGNLDYEGYHQLWSEKWADELGKSTLSSMPDSGSTSR